MNNQPGPLESLGAFAIVIVITVALVRVYDWSVSRTVNKLMNKDKCTNTTL